MSSRKSPDARRAPRFLLTILAACIMTAPGRAAEPSPTPQTGGEKIETFRVHESFTQIWVDTHAPYSPELQNETQSRELAKEAATVLGQNAILQYVLKKRTAKGKPLEEARIPSTEVQQHVKALIQGAQVGNVRFGDDGCRLRVSVEKKNLKIILRKA